MSAKRYYGKLISSATPCRRVETVISRLFSGVLPHKPLIGCLFGRRAGLRYATFDSLSVQVDPNKNAALVWCDAGRTFDENHDLGTCYHLAVASSGSKSQ